MRLVELRRDDAYFHMGMEEAILKARIAGLVDNTLRFFTWKPSSISIGYFQSLEEEVDYPACVEMGIDVVRRPTGGGAVYHDEAGEITYSVVVSQELVPADILASIRYITSGVVRALELLGVKAELAGINDVVVAGRKISGSAQLRREGMILQHGTLLLDVKPDMMFRVLKVAGEKISDKAIADVRKRVTCLRELGDFEFEEVRGALVQGFELALGLKPREGRLTEWELREAERLKREKYSTRQWNFRR